MPWVTLKEGELQACSEKWSAMNRWFKKASSPEEHCVYKSSFQLHTKSINFTDELFTKKSVEVWKSGLKTKFRCLSVTLSKDGGRTSEFAFQWNKVLVDWLKLTWGDSQRHNKKTESKERVNTVSVSENYKAIKLIYVVYHLLFFSFAMHNTTATCRATTDRAANCITVLYLQ